MCARASYKYSTAFLHVAMSKLHSVIGLEQLTLKMFAMARPTAIGQPSRCTLNIYYRLDFLRFKRINASILLHSIEKASPLMASLWLLRIFKQIIIKMRSYAKYYGFTKWKPLEKRMYACGRSSLSDIQVVHWKRAAPAVVAQLVGNYVR